MLTRQLLWVALVCTTGCRDYSRFAYSADAGRDAGTDAKSPLPDLHRVDLSVPRVDASVPCSGALNTGFCENFDEPNGGRPAGWTTSVQPTNGSLIVDDSTFGGDDSARSLLVGIMAPGSAWITHPLNLASGDDIYIREYVDVDASVATAVEIVGLARGIQEGGQQVWLSWDSSAETNVAVEINTSAGTSSIATNASSAMWTCVAWHLAAAPSDTTEVSVGTDGSLQHATIPSVIKAPDTLVLGQVETLQSNATYHIDSVAVSPSPLPCE